MKDILKLFDKIRTRNSTRREFYLVMKYLIENELKTCKQNKDIPCEGVLENILDNLSRYYYED